MKTFGQIAFDAYNNSGPTPGLTYDGNPIPPWNELAELTRERWEASARAAWRARLDRLGQDRTDLRDALLRAEQRFGEQCVAHNGPLSLRYFVEILEDELHAPVHGAP